MAMRASSFRVVSICFVSLAATCLTGCSHRIPQQYAGTWLLRTSESNMMLLMTEVHGAKLRGKLTQPKHFTEQTDGTFIEVNLPVTTRPLSGRRARNAIAIEIGDPPDVDQASMVLLDHDHLSLDAFHGFVPAWKFERVPVGGETTLKSDWLIADQSPQVISFRERLRLAAEEDRTAREKEHLDEEEITRLEVDALPLIKEIFQAYGWPTVTAFGSQATSDYWLLVQYQSLDIQQRMLQSLQEAVNAGEASKTNYAYLLDRIEVSEGKSQHWGTQSKCDHGHAVRYPLDASIRDVNARRKAIGLANLGRNESEILCQRSVH